MYVFNLASNCNLCELSAAILEKGLHVFFSCVSNTK